MGGSGGGYDEAPHDLEPREPRTDDDIPFRVGEDVTDLRRSKGGRPKQIREPQNHYHSGHLNMPTKQRQQIRKGPHGGMQLVLTEDVANLGKQGELVEVKPGYGRNYLLPNGLATIPSEHNLRLLDRYKQRVQQRAKRELPT